MTFARPSPRSVLFTLILGAVAGAQSPAGEWRGTIEVPGQELEVHVSLRQGESGSWSGDIDIPAQNAADLALTDIAVRDRAIEFAIAGVPGEPRFAGELDASGVELAGTFTQHDQGFPFRLGRAAPATDDVAAALDGLTTWLDATRSAWNVPGVAVAVVKGDELVHAACSGKRDLEQDLPVTPDTLFAIGSATKAVTTFVLATLVDEGRLAWDQPVRTWMPDLQLADEAIAAALTPRDLVTHRSGMPRHDLLWYNADFTRADMVRRLRWLPFSKGLRAEFQYNNLMYLTAGHLAERIAGATWEDLVRARVLAPLEMVRTNFSVRDSAADPDHAEPYRREQEVVRHIPFRDITAVGPAGSINSSVRELARWVAVHLSKGSRGDRRLLQPATVADLHAPRMPSGREPSKDTPQIVPVGNALGWFADVYRGHRRVHHGGNIDGIGYAVLANLDATPLPELVARQVADRLLDLDAVDYGTAMLGKRQEGEAKEREGKANAALERRDGTQPSHSLDELAGEYEHAGYGIAAVRVEGGALRLELHRIEAPLEHWHYDVFRAGRNDADPTLEDTRVQFVTGMDGEVEALRAAVEPNVPAQTFVRLPDAQLRDPAFLQRLVGDYEIGKQTLSVALKGGVLSVSTQGQPTYDLEPGRRCAFRLKGLEGYSVRFLLDEQGAVVGVRMVQPDGVYQATRRGR